MRADENVIERESLAEQLMHAVQFTAGLVAAGEARLIGGGDKDKAGGLELFDKGYGFLIDFEVLQS